MEIQTCVFLTAAKTASSPIMYFWNKVAFIMQIAVVLPLAYLTAHPDLSSPYHVCLDDDDKTIKIPLQICTFHRNIEMSVQVIW